MYHIDVYDCCGHYTGTEATTFENAVAWCRTWRERFPRKVVRVTNPDQSDDGSDGLTEDERDLLDRWI